MRKRSELEISINDWKSAIGMADAFDMAWSVVKGESSNWDWYKKRAPYWKESFAELAEMMPDKAKEGTFDNWYEQDIENDAIEESGPAVNDALVSIGEPKLANTESLGDGPKEPPVGKRVNFGNFMNSKLGRLVGQRRGEWTDDEGSIENDLKYRKDLWNKDRDWAGLTTPSQRMVGTFSEDNPDPLDSLMEAN